MYLLYLLYLWFRVLLKSSLVIYAEVQDRPGPIRVFKERPVPIKVCNAPFNKISLCTKIMPNYSFIRKRRMYLKQILHKLFDEEAYYTRKDEYHFQKQDSADL